jgi:hypothetical protein
MEPDAITQYIVETFDDVEVVVASDDSFFFVNPRGLPPDHRLPFATLVTTDQHDSASNLGLPGVYRLNIGVSPGTFGTLFDSPVSAVDDIGDAERDDDFTALDQLMPHPVYGTMFWVGVLNPSPATFDAVRPLLTEAYDRARERRVKSRPEVVS